MRMQRTRWAAMGATAALIVGAGGVLTSSASTGPAASSFVPITSCRLLDTRPAPDNVGPRATALGVDEVLAATVWGTNGQCTIPTSATAVSMNVTVISPTSASYLTVYPSDASPRPLVSSLNWVAGQPPTPNAVTTRLSADGKVSFYNLAGSVHLIADIVGYYVPSTSGPTGPVGNTGPTGPTGPAGPTGDPGPRPAHVVWVATSGGDYTSVRAALAAIGTTLPAASATTPYVIKIAPGVYEETAVVALENYVDLEGSGRSTTVLSCTCEVAGSLTSALSIAGAGMHVGLRDLTVSVAGTIDPASLVAAVHADHSSGGAVTFDGVALTASTTGINFGLLAVNSDVSLRDVVIDAHGGADGSGLLLESSSAVIDDSRISAASDSGSPAVYINGSQAVIHDAHLVGAPAVLRISGPTMIWNSVIEGGTTGVGAARCSGTVTEALAPYACV